MKRWLEFTTATQYLLLERGGEGVESVKEGGGGKKGWTNFKKGMMKPHSELWIA